MVKKAVSLQPVEPAPFEDAHAALIRATQELHLLSLEEPASGFCDCLELQYIRIGMMIKACRAAASSD